MIDLKLISVIGVTLALCMIVANSQNIKYQRNGESNAAAKSMTPRKYHLKTSNRNRQYAPSNLDAAESDAHHSYRTAAHNDLAPSASHRGGGAHHSRHTANSDLAPSASHHAHHGGGHGYFHYIRVPHPHAWEFGYRKGNPWHFREQHEQGMGGQFKTKLRWGDKHGGYGEHYWDYNHVDKGDHKH